MIEIPSLSEEQIRERISAESFRRGLDYFRSGAILDPRRQGMTLKARCAGSRAEPYRLWATIGGQGVIAADCSCPVGTGGACKHVAALLLTWLRTPDRFLEQEELDASLERRTKEELIALVKQMLRQRPELEPLLATPLPGTGRRHEPVQPETYRRQAAAIFQRDYDWGDAVDVAEELLAILNIGDGFVRQGDYADAVAVYTAVAEEVLEGYELFHDDDGELAGVVTDCVDGLGTCLEDEQDDAATRETVLEALFAVYRFDVDYGGVGLGDDVPGLVEAHATTEEQRAVAGWVRDTLAAVPEGQHSNWRREQYGGFLLDLEADTLDDEAFLQICRETGRTKDLVNRLLQVHRVDEAVEEAQRASDYGLIELADVFVEYGEVNLAERLMAERCRSTEDSRIAGWLKDHYHAKGDATACLEFAVQAFRLRPEIEGYQELRAIAGAPGGWEELRPALLGFLAEHEHTRLLVRVRLADGEVDEALDAFQLFSSAGPFAPGFGLGQEVASAAESSRPQAALEIYQRQAEAQIALRTRGHYREACRLLDRMRAVYQRMGDEQGVASYIGTLRERYRSLRALSEELAAVGL